MAVMEPLKTASVTIYTPEMSGKKKGLLVFAFRRTAPLFAGRVLNSHENVSNPPSASLDAVPSRVTTFPTTAS
jgi:hypothetical protein